MWSKVGNDVNRHFLKEAIQMANVYLKLLNISNYQRNANVWIDEQKMS
jgi:hypothetical protein